MNMLLLPFLKSVCGKRRLIRESFDMERGKIQKASGNISYCISLSFAGIKADNLEDAKSQIKASNQGLYEQNRYFIGDKSA